MAHYREEGHETVRSVCYRMCMSTVTVAFTGQSHNIVEFVLIGKPIFCSNNFWDVLPETCNYSGCWDIGGNSHLTWLSSDSLYLP